MTYTATKLDNGMHRIEMEDGSTFNVIATDDSQVDELVQFHLDFLNSDQTPTITYDKQRAQEYPSYSDQFDLLYHGGYDAWKAAIDAVKTKYPKP